MVGAWKGVAGFATNIWEGTKGIAKKIGGAVGGFFSNLKFWDAGWYIRFRCSSMGE